MDILTHGLASFALARAFFPRVSRTMMVGIVIAGTIADLDSLSRFFGPSAYFAVHGTFTHSIFGALLIAALVSGFLYKPLFQAGASRTSFALLLFAPFCGAALHLVMDMCQSQGVALLWPFSPRRFAADCVANIDLWILIILIVGIALPELFRLVGSEIGAKEKKPRGQSGAIVALTFVLAYMSVRATLHANAIAALDSSTYHGESPRRVTALPEPVSPFTWHGIVETLSSLHQLDVIVGPGGSFNPEAGVSIHKPEASPVLEAARAAETAQQFLRIAQFPKVSMEQTGSGYEVVLRDLRYAAAGHTVHEVAAVIKLDSNGKVVAQEDVWASELQRR